MKAIFRHTKHLGIAALLSSLVALAACSTDSEDASAVDAKPTVALIMKSLANEFFVTMAAAAERHQDERQDTYELIVNGIKNESDLAQQVALVDQMIALGVDAIVIAPADSKALVPAPCPCPLERHRGREHRQPTRSRRAGRVRLGHSFHRPGQPQGCQGRCHGCAATVSQGRERRRSRRCDERPQRDRAPARVHRGDH